MIISRLIKLDITNVYQIYKFQTFELIIISIYKFLSGNLRANNPSPSQEHKKIVVRTGEEVGKNEQCKNGRIATSNQCKITEEKAHVCQRSVDDRRGQTQPLNTNHAATFEQAHWLIENKGSANSPQS